MSKADSLKARRAVIDMLHAIVGERTSLEDAQQHFREYLSEQDRRFAAHLLLISLRHYWQHDALLKRFLSKPLPNKVVQVRYALHIGVTQLLHMEVPAHAAIDTSVELVKKMGFRHHSGLVNAVLKKVSQHEAQALSPLDALPQWLQKSWRQAYGKEGLKAIAKAQLQRPKLDITVAQQPDMWAERLQAQPLFGNTLRCELQDVTALSGYEEGQWWVQDIAASLPVNMMGDVAGKTVIDACAAPGGKTAQLVAAGAQVLALDKSGKRLERMKENMQRLHMDAQYVQADVLSWQPQEKVDMVLLDAPCTATGTARRHPDVLLHKTPQDVEEMCALQSEMLRRVSQWVKPSGHVLYCTCSLQPEEGEKQVEAFLKTHPHWQVDAGLMPNDWPVEWRSEQGFLRVLPSFLPEKGGMDGFFAALLTQNSL